MTLIMLAYYLICGCLLALAFWNFLREKESRQDWLLYLLIMIPLILMLLRIK